MATGIWTATSVDYARTLRGLLPRGVIWAREPSNRLALFLSGIADELARVHASASSLMTEADPATTTTAGLLPEWERVTGLPEFGWAPTTEDERRTALAAKLTATGGSSPAYFEAMALAYGAHEPVRATNGPSPHWWTIEAPNACLRATCLDDCGDAIVTFEACTPVAVRALNTRKPAHTAIFWTDYKEGFA